MTAKIACVLAFLLTGRAPEDGSPAGSALTMDRAMVNLTTWLNLPEEQVWAMGMSDSARLLCLAAKDTPHAGTDSGFAYWKQAADRLSVLRTLVSGRCVFPTSTIT